MERLGGLVEQRGHRRLVLAQAVLGERGEGGGAEGGEPRLNLRLELRRRHHRRLDQDGEAARLAHRAHATLHDVPELPLRAQLVEGILRGHLRESEQRRVLESRHRRVDLQKELNGRVDLIGVGRHAA